MKRVLFDFFALVILAIGVAGFQQLNGFSLDIHFKDHTVLVNIIGGILAMIALVFLARLFFLPYFIARDRKHRNTTPILLTNIFFGWSLVGWMISLIWANTSNVEEARQSNVTTQNTIKGHQYTDKWDRAA